MINHDEPSIFEKRQIPESIDDLAIDALPISKFARMIGGTGYGTSKELAKTVKEFVDYCLEGTPRGGIVYFKKLPDGTYEIGQYKSKE